MVEREKPKSTCGRENRGYGGRSEVGGFLADLRWVGSSCSSCPLKGRFRTWVSITTLSDDIAMAEMPREAEDSGLNMRLYVWGL